MTAKGLLSVDGALPALADDEVLWRYMSAEKFIYLLERRRLYLPRADRFRDPYEGLLTKPMADAMDVEQNRLPATYDTYVSCWCRREDESAAMWNIYLDAKDEGVAIRTTAARLTHVSDAAGIKGHLARVTYLNYATESYGQPLVVTAFGHKRRSFNYEEEARLIVWRQRNKQFADADALAMEVPIDVGALIDAVYISPTAGNWFTRAMKMEVDAAGLNVPVSKSDLYSVR